MPTLQIITASTRPGRVGPAVAEWVHRRAEAHGTFTVEAVDLADVSLPLLDEPHHPRLAQYTHQATRDWSATVERADAFVLVMPEYNHSFNAALKNALDHLFVEWGDKPVAFVSYGGQSGGLRAVSAIKPVVAALRMVPVLEAVAIPFVHGRITEGVFAADDGLDGAAQAMLDELARLTDLLASARPAGR
jgi:NAD(P)H-dependent FMN reductase